MKNIKNFSKFNSFVYKKLSTFLRKNKFSITDTEFTFILRKSEDLINERNYQNKNHIEKQSLNFLSLNINKGNRILNIENNFSYDTILILEKFMKYLKIFEKELADFFYEVDNNLGYLHYIEKNNLLWNQEYIRLLELDKYLFCENKEKYPFTIFFNKEEREVFFKNRLYLLCESHIKFFNENELIKVINSIVLSINNKNESNIEDLLIMRKTIKRLEHIKNNFGKKLKKKFVLYENDRIMIVSDKIKEIIEIAKKLNLYFISVYIHQETNKEWFEDENLVEIIEIED